MGAIESRTFGGRSGVESFLIDMDRKYGLDFFLISITESENYYTVFYRNPSYYVKKEAKKPTEEVDK